jgi:hypothetical protein
MAARIAIQQIALQSHYDIWEYLFMGYLFGRQQIRNKRIIHTLNSLRDMTLIPLRSAVASDMVSFHLFQENGVQQMY